MFTVDQLVDYIFDDAVVVGWGTFSNKEDFSAPSMVVKEGECIITMDVPGQDKSSLIISFKGSKCYVKGDNKESEKVFKQSFVVGDNMDKAKTEAKVKNGILTIRIPEKKKSTFTVNIQ